MPMNVVIPRWGSAGDVVPSLAVGAELRRRGHRVTFVGNPSFTPLAVEAGLEVSPVGTIEDHRRLMDDAAIFDRDGKDEAQVLAEHYLPAVGGFYETVAALTANRASVIVGGEVGSSLVAEKFGIPLVAVASSPGTERALRSRHDPVHPERILPAWAAWFAKTGGRLAFLYGVNNAMRATLHMMTRWQGAAPPVPGPVLRLREAAGLPREMRTRPDLFLCMWPEWFAPPQRDWPQHAVIAGFPFFPRPRRGAAHGPADAGPVVVTTGSMAGAQREFHARAVAACAALGREAILVTPHRADVPEPLPPSVTYMERAPFHELFGGVSLVIHHGGIGTASYALAAGVPQVVMPIRGDQFDNANRLDRLGVASVLPAAGTSWQRLASTVSRLLASREAAGRCGYWKSRIDPDEGCTRAADCIERLVAAGPAARLASGRVAALETS